MIGKLPRLTFSIINHYERKYGSGPEFRSLGWFLIMVLVLMAWCSLSSMDDGPSSSFGVDAFFFDKFERLKRITLPTAFAGLGNLVLPGLSSGIRVCINFNSLSQGYPQSYQQNTCFLCEAYRFNSIAYQCTGQTQIPSNINFTQANCIMNNCQPMVYGQQGQNQLQNRFPASISTIGLSPHQQFVGYINPASLMSHHQQSSTTTTNQQNGQQQQFH